MNQGGQGGIIPGNAQTLLLREVDERWIMYPQVGQELIMRLHAGGEFSVTCGVRELAWVRRQACSLRDLAATNHGMLAEICPQGLAFGIAV